MTAMKTDMKQWVSSLIGNPQRNAIPVNTHTGIEMAGHSVYEAVTDGAVHAEAVLTLAGKFPSAALCTIMDLTVEAEAMGAEIVFQQHEVPSVKERLISSQDEIGHLAVPDPDQGRIAQYVEATRLIAEAADRPLLSGCIGPYSLAGRLFDMSELMILLYTDTETAHLLLAKCTDFIVKYARALKTAGANGLFIAEPAAGLLPDDACRDFSSVYVRKIVEAVQDDSFIVILHNCGNTGQCTRAMSCAGAAGYHFGNAIDMEQTAKELPQDVLVMGNIDPVGVMKSAGSDEVYAACRALLDKMRDYPNYVLSTGCDTPPGVPLENIEAFYRAATDYNQTRR